MDGQDIYKDIAKRSGGDIYLGVVGPVRTGKSTFITNFVNSMIIPNIQNVYEKERAIDELPQSAVGKTIMTTQPKFVPNEAVKVSINDAEMKIRLIDCVGYVIDGAEGINEDSKPRMVKTPWSEKEMPFDVAAEIGTKKVITDHSNIALLVTTDGSFTDIPRQNYVVAEERVVRELKEYNKPFVIILNSNNPNSEQSVKLQKELQEKYKTRVLLVDVLNMNMGDVTRIFDAVLNEFPVNSIQVKMPRWMQALNYNNSLIVEVVNEIKNVASNIAKIGDFKLNNALFANSENFEPLTESKIILSEGNIALSVEPKPDVFYKILSEQCGYSIANEFELITQIKELSHAKREYDKLKNALSQVEETGYGVVFPDMSEMKLEDPQIVKQGGKFGVKLKASAPSLHIMRVDINTEVNPIVGTEQQSEEMVKYLLSEFENNPQGIWETNMFGKSLHQLVNEGLNNKLYAMPNNTQVKMRKTLSRIVNEGKGGVICILL